MAFYAASDGVAVITLGGEGEFPWGTRCEEHRINFETVNALNAALDKALADATVQVMCCNFLIVV